MTPVGQHIQITKPEPINKFIWLIEKQPISKAKVVAISPDVNAPFAVLDTVYFYTNKEILHSEQYFINYEMIQGYD